MVEVLTGPRFARAIRAGALAVVREQESLNRINVFPVPDADTGANLASTLRAAATAMSTRLTLSLGQAARSVADAALDGARGNSGAILAQFFHGLAEAIENRGHVRTLEFAAAVKCGAESAQQALTHPVEGTILSVLRAWAQAIEDNANGARDFSDLLARGLERAREALAFTPKQLAVLARHGVVDAGAQGFVYFLEGVSSFFRSRAAASWAQAKSMFAQQPTPFAAAHAEFDTTYRYCSEALLVGNRLDRKAIARAADELGGSVVVAGGGSRLRVHVHTNEPQRLFALLATLGSVERTKIEDMVLQQLASRDARIALVTDSTCDLPEALAYAIGLVRVPLTMSFGEQTFTDGVDITPLQFYEKLAAFAGTPKTSQPAVGEFRNTYSKLLESHDGVLSLHLSAGLSGTHQAAVAAAAQIDPERIRVIDTGQISTSLGLVAEAAGEAIARGMLLAEAAAAVERCCRNTKIFAMFGTLEMVVKGGRVSPSFARIADLLRLRPLITIGADGKAERTGAGVGYHAAMRKIVARAARFARGAPVRLLICHANVLERAEYLAEKLCERFHTPDIPIVSLTAVLAAHAGPGAVAVGVHRLTDT